MSSQLLYVLLLIGGFIIFIGYYFFCNPTINPKETKYLGDYLELMKESGEIYKKLCLLQVNTPSVTKDNPNVQELLKKARDCALKKRDMIDCKLVNLTKNQRDLVIEELATFETLIL
jgi:hypothetical protein